MLELMRFKRISRKVSLSCELLILELIKFLNKLICKYRDLKQISLRNLENSAKTRNIQEKTTRFRDYCSSKNMKELKVNRKIPFGTTIMNK